ncbi:MAG: hypothetical protein EHM28_12775 [Spirochaetaceae bacterium]|nr:MAG: hypothetical protein EHM28_12775 [Spirochaetaceae bacterium]
MKNITGAIVRLLDNEGNGIAAPDFKKLFSMQRKRTLRRRITLAFAGVAAAMLITGGSYLGMHFSRQMEDYRILEIETHQFVDNLFSEPLLDGVEYLSSEQ